MALKNNNRSETMMGSRSKIVEAEKNTKLSSPKNWDFHVILETLKFSTTLCGSGRGKSKSSYLVGCEIVMKKDDASTK